MSIRLTLLAASLAAAGTAAAAQNAGSAVPTRATLVSALDNGFKAVDTNKDGSISTAEAAAAETKIMQEKVGAVRTQFEADFAKLDTNKDGNVSKAEFMALVPATPAKPDGKSSMARFDANKDGKITLDEFKTPQVATFDKLDTNKDGTLSDAERQAASASR